MSKQTNDTKRLHTIAINVRWADEPLSAMSLRLTKAAADLQPLEPGKEFWSDGRPIVQLGSLEPWGGYLRQVEGNLVGYFKDDDPGGAVRRLATKADVFGIDAPVEPSTEAEVGRKIRSIIEAGREVGAKVVPYLACENGEPSKRQQGLRNSMLEHRVTVWEVPTKRYDLVPEWLRIKNEALADVPPDYLDGAPLTDYLAASEAEMDSFQLYLYVMIESVRDHGFISSLIQPPE